MREDLDRLLAQATLVTVALAVALGWSLFQVAKGVADLVTGLLTKYPSGSEIRFAASLQPASWIVHGRVLALGALITGVVELAVVSVIAGWLLRSAHRAPPTA